MEDLYRLAQLLQQRTIAEHQIALQVGRSPSQGEIVEYILRNLLQITQDSSVQHDGRFTEGELAGRLVEIKYFTDGLSLEALRHALDKPQPDYYLLAVGASLAQKQALMCPNALTIEAIYLLSASELASLLTSVSGKRASEALLEPFQIYPEPRNPLICLSEEQRDVLERFSLAELESELRWQRAFETSQDKLEAMAEEAHQAYLRGETLPLTLE